MLLYRRWVKNIATHYNYIVKECKIKIRNYNSLKCNSVDDKHLLKLTNIHWYNHLKCLLKTQNIEEHIVKNKWKK